jgi:hypothetical protein
MEYEQVGAQNVVIEQGEYRRWVRDQIGRSISGQLAILVSLLGSGGFLAIAAGAFTYVNYQRDAMERELEDALEATMRYEVEREVGYQVARAITDATQFAGDLANSVSRDPVLRRQFFEELFTAESVGALTGVAAGQRSIDPDAPPAIRRFALSQVAVFGPELLPGVAAELLLGGDAPRELYEQALEYYDRYEEGAAPDDIDVGADSASSGGDVFLRLTRVGQILGERDADWTSVHDAVVGRVLDRLLAAGGDQSCDTSPAYCAFFANLSAAEADAAFARFALHLRGEGKNEPWNAAFAPLASVDGARGVLARAPALYADAQVGGRTGDLDAVLQLAIGRFEIDGNMSPIGPATADALDALDLALAEGDVAAREATARLVALRIAEKLDAVAAPPADSAVDAFAPRPANELARTVRSLQRAAADPAPTNQRRAVALRTLEAMLALAPEASAEYRLGLEMADVESLSPPGEALAAPTRMALDDLRARARDAYPWRDDGGVARDGAAALAPNGATLTAARWGRIDLTAPGLAGELPIAIDVATPIVGYLIVGDDGLVVDGALGVSTAGGRTQILVDRADLKSERAYIRFEPVDPVASVEVAAPQRPPVAPVSADRAGAGQAGALAIERAYRVEPEAVNGTQAWLRFTAPADGFYRVGLLASATSARSFRVAVYPEGGDAALMEPPSSTGVAEPSGAWYATAGESYDIMLEGQGVTAPIGLRLRSGAGVRLDVGESRRLALEGSTPVLVSIPTLDVGIYRLRTFELTGGADTVLELSNSRGQVLSTDDDGGDEGLASAIAFTVRSAENYVASVRGFGDETRGEFSVQLVRTGEWTGETATLASGLSLRLSFQDSNPVELGLAAQQPGEYRVYTHGLDADVDTVLEVFTAEGESVAVNDDGGDEPLASSVTFRSEGEGFFASVRSYGDVGVGEFNVQLDRIGD